MRNDWGNKKQDRGAYLEAAFLAVLTGAGILSFLYLVLSELFTA